ncbi:uncharacterized protein C19orf44 homolog [Xyrauchen texanus]|uniref:uncharacterized protein C19orf44 homolog n=1 Tax=Xyrauchen texanus TaxID=154827 RepID=UPI002241EF83|nr:uncharacterized protein C19orf44 homolog [Xyrauchen texanus]XP_051977975.1 uncharacterized protein C19orf44 homolog [Xyrauchen texanus]
MWTRGGPRSSVLDRANALLSGQRISNTGISKDKTDVGNSGKFIPQARQTQFLELSNVSSPSTSQNLLDPTKTTLESFSMGGGSRFLKKTSKDATGDKLLSTPSETPAKNDEFKLIPQRNSQSTALSRLALIENRIKNQKSKGDAPGIETDFSEPLETPVSVQSNSDLIMTGSRFLKMTTVSVPQEQKFPERATLDNIPGLIERKGRRVSLDSDEQDMKRLLGDSLSLSESSQQNTARQRSYRKTSEQSTLPSPAPERHKQQHQVLRRLSPSPPTSPKPPSPSRPDSHRVRFTERSVSSESSHSEIRSLDDLFPVPAVSDADDTLSERSSASDDFKLNVMTLGDLAPIPLKTAEKKETEARQEVRNRKSSTDIARVYSPATPKEPSADYESDFESEIPSETAKSASEISENLTDDDKDASLVSEAKYSLYKSKEEDVDHSLSETSRSSKDSYSDTSTRSSFSNATITHSRSPDRCVKEAAVQTQPDGLTYTWSSGMAAVGPSVGMTYVDPAPIATHTVSAEAIESLTSYSPAVVALNDMLRQQLALTRAFIESTRHHYTSVLDSLGPADYKYTTLDDTKEFIRAHRPPKLSIEDALEEVLQEMRDYH